MLRTEITGWDITYIIIVVIMLVVAYVCYREGENNGFDRGYKLGVKDAFAYTSKRSPRKRTHKKSMTQELNDDLKRG